MQETNKSVVKKRKIFPGWLVAITGFLCLTIGLGSLSTFPIFLKSFEMEFGWSRSVISGYIAVATFFAAVVAPLAGICIDRYGGLRRIMIVGVVAMAMGNTMFGFMNSILHFYTAAAIIGVGYAAGTFLPVQVLISLWFKKKRGTVMAVVFTGIGAGGFIMPLLANLWLSMFGWRNVFFILSFIILTLLIPVYFWIHHKPSDLGLLPDGELSGEIKEKGSAEKTTAADFVKKDNNSLSLAKAIRTRTFWALISGDFLMGAIVASFTIHFVAFSTDNGIPQVLAATCYSIQAALAGLAMFPFGWAADRFSIRGMMLISYVSVIIAVPLLFNISIMSISIFVLVIGISAAGRVVMWPLAIGHCFGLGHFGTLNGWMVVPFTLGNAIGPLIAGHIYDTTNSYQLWFTACLGLSFVSSFLIYLMRNERKMTGRLEYVEK